MLITLTLLAVAGAQDSGGVPNFGRDVQPLLAKHCFLCHGPDEGTRKADLRLDLPDIVDDGRGIIVAGHPEQSELISRITTHAAGDLMPPPEESTLAPGEIALIEQWIANGAKYERHWAFQAVGHPTPPPQSAWGDNAIDAFVHAQLREAGLQPPPQADRATLIRRLSFDLCGMPPTPTEIVDFANDDSPQAYENLVDRLLDSSAYAERMTLAWMDAARYGDTSVHHADGVRDMWPWRDWVIAAYDQNMPFDQFTVEQLAGDLFPDPTHSQRVASGFHRNSPTSDEGGAIDEELRVKYMVDRVRTTGNVWLGLSMECGQCHAHKYDPISQEDYYRFYAFFNQSVEKGFQSRNGNAVPRIPAPTTKQANEQAALETQLQDAEAHLAWVAPPLDELEEWCSKAREEQLQHPLPEFGSWYGLGPIHGLPGKSTFDTDLGPEAIEFDPTQVIAGQTWQMRSDEDGKLHRFNDVDNSAIYLTRTIDSAMDQSIELSFGSDDGIIAWVNGVEILRNNTGRAVAADQELVSIELPKGTSRLLIKIVNEGGHTGYYFKLRTGLYGDNVRQALALEPQERSEVQRGVLSDYFTRNVWPPGIEQSQTANSVSGELAALKKSYTTVMVMKDVDTPRMTYVLERGQYDSPRKDTPLDPGVLENLLPMPDGAPANRMGLAQWLVHPEHPLTARVAVNRYWAMIFGRGLVRTVMDFGTQGDRPSHPELLDWLARDFIDHGFDVKRTLKLIAMSTTYRQASFVDATRHQLSTATDPENTLHWHAPRFRMPGEFLRDQALAVSGTLVDRVGGPGVKPYQPPGLWNEVALDRNLKFSQDHGEKLYRKSMYTYWKRSAPHPAMATFDTPIRDTCVVQRQCTNTPMQALVTLNDVQFVEAARNLAQRLLTERSDLNERLDLGFILCTAHPASEVERRVMTELLTAQREIYSKDPEAALALLALGESPRDESLDPGEHASWAILASMLLNLDETLNRE